MLARQREQRATPAALELDPKLDAIGGPPPDDLSAYDRLRDREAGR